MRRAWLASAVLTIGVAQANAAEWMVEAHYADAAQVQAMVQALESHSLVQKRN